MLYRRRKRARARIPQLSIYIYVATVAYNNTNFTDPRDISRGETSYISRKKPSTCACSVSGVKHSDVLCSSNNLETVMREGGGREYVNDIYTLARRKCHADLIVRELSRLLRVIACNRELKSFKAEFES